MILTRVCRASHAVAHGPAGIQHIPIHPHCQLDPHSDISSHPASSGKHAYSKQQTGARGEVPIFAKDGWASRVGGRMITIPSYGEYLQLLKTFTSPNFKAALISILDTCRNATSRRNPETRETASSGAHQPRHDPSFFSNSAGLKAPGRHLKASKSHASSFRRALTGCFQRQSKKPLTILNFEAPNLRSPLKKAASITVQSS